MNTLPCKREIIVPGNTGTSEGTGVIIASAPKFVGQPGPRPEGLEKLAVTSSANSEDNAHQ